MGHSQYDNASCERAAWNAGKQVGTKRPLTQKQIWAVRMVDNTIQSKGAARHLCRAAIVSAQMLLLSPPNDIPGRGQQQHQNRARQECKLRARHDAQQGSEAGRVREGRQQVVDDGVLDHIKAEKCSRQ